MRTQDMQIIDLTGPPRQRGQIMGEALREQIHALNATQVEALNARPGYEARAYFAAFDRFSRHREAVEQITPDLLEEVWGLAEGAALTREEAFRMQLGDEDLSFDMFHFGPAVRNRDKCTAFAAVEEDGRTYAGQNMDVAPYVEGHQVLLRVREERSESLVFTYAGMIALCGMSNAPLGVTCNTLVQLGGSSQGLPVAFMVRALLQKQSFEEALAFLHRAPHASGQNYILSSPGRVGSFECSPHKVAEYRACPNGKRVCHTNHPLANDDTSSFDALQQGKREGGWAGLPTNSTLRFDSIAKRTVHHAEANTLDTLKAALRAKDDPKAPVCRARSEGAGPAALSFTAGSVIYDLNAPVALHVAAGPPTEADYRVIQLAEPCDA